MAKGLSCEKARFKLPPGLHYLNCATFSPTSKRVEQAGISAFKKITNPDWLQAADFFKPAELLRHDLARLLGVTQVNNIALMPAVSYGMAALSLNLHRKPGLQRGQEILILGTEFPNHGFGLERRAQELGLTIRSVPKPEGVQIGKVWNQLILEQITQKTCLVVVTQVHWFLGIVFDLEAIGKRCREVGALLAVDGTQSFGAMRFDFKKIHPDLLMVAGYKWMMAPYSIGFAYYGSFFHDGIPVEESWMNRMYSDQFHRLTEYEPNYLPGAQRFNPGEYSQFIQLPMFRAAVQDVLRRKPERIQEYCNNLVEPAIATLEEAGYQFEEPSYRAGHLYGIHVPAHLESSKLHAQLNQRQIKVAMRDKTIRLSPNVYNDSEDINAFVDCLVAAARL